MQAVLLAAGRGSRLGRLTDDRPKCLLEVGGAPLIDAVLACLGQVGVEDVVVVIGYQADRIRRHLAGRRVELVENPDFARTNNAVSLQRARGQLRPPFLLADGDLWLSRRLATALVAPDRIALARPRPGMTGTMASVADDRAVALGPTGSHKTVNAASFSTTWWSDHLAPALDRLIAEGRTGAFYEAAIADALAAGAPPLDVVLAGDRDWAEIDTPHDLAAAGRLVAGAR